MRDYQESVTTGQTLDKVIPMCPYALQVTQQRAMNCKSVFHGMHYVPEKRKWGRWIARKKTDGKIDERQVIPLWQLLHRCHKK